MKYFIIAALIVLTSISVFAQKNNDIVETTFKVEGNCGDCKKRIENAAYLKGVKRAEWDKETDMITVIYRSSKTNLNEIKQSIADAGHEADGIAANEEAYESLPGCCKYKTESCED